MAAILKRKIAIYPSKFPETVEWKILKLVINSKCKYKKSTYYGDGLKTAKNPKSVILDSSQHNIFTDDLRSFVVLIRRR